MRAALLRVTLLACLAATGAHAGAREEREKFARLRFAAGTFAARHPLSDVASQSWRRFVPSWLVTSALNVSNVTALPDPPWPHSPHDKWWAVPSQFLGDQRNGAAIRLGNATDDAYDWVLYGDDDTVFLVDNALEMLRGLDPAVPYFLGDALSMDSCAVRKHGHFCALPGTPESTSTRVNGSTCVMHPAVAPCVRALFDANGTVCSTAGTMWWGGSGYVYSRGMVHAISPELWHDFDARKGESDAIAAQLVWAAGFAPTNPTWMPHSAVHNDSLPNTRTVVDGKAVCRFGRDNGFRQVWDAAKRVIAGADCDDSLCQHLLFNRVGVHLGAGKAHTDPAALLRLMDDVREMYMDYELAKALLREAQCEQSCAQQPPAQMAACQQQCQQQQTQNVDQAQTDAANDYAAVEAMLREQTASDFTGLTSTDWEPSSN